MTHEKKTLAKMTFFFPIVAYHFSILKLKCIAADHTRILAVESSNERDESEESEKMLFSHAYSVTTLGYHRTLHFQ